MNDESIEEQPPEWTVWPPPRANRATRRHCQHLVKVSYCALCGEKIKP